MNHDETPLSEVFGTNHTWCHITQREEPSCSGSQADALANLRSIIRNRDSTVSPAFSNSIICSRVNPACSPATANLKTLAAMDGAAMPHLVGKGYVAWDQSSVTCITNKFGKCWCNRTFVRCCCKIAIA